MHLLILSEKLKEKLKIEINEKNDKPLLAVLVQKKGLEPS